jgi:hypothetical protein
LSLTAGYAHEDFFEAYFVFPEFDQARSAFHQDLRYNAVIDLFRSKSDFDFPIDG